MTDPSVERVSVMKSARVGCTKALINATVGYHIHHDPTTIMVVQPNRGDAEGYSKEEIAPMLRDCPALAACESPRRSKGGRNSEDTILLKQFRGATLQVVGAHSGAGFRRVSRRIILCDEVDAYPPSAGSEGDPVKLAERRSETYYNRKIICVSTPLLAEASRIEALFMRGDQRRFHVPCPHCGYRDILVFEHGGEDARGHYMQWPDGEPENAYFMCRKNGCVIEHREKRAMVEAGQWIADAPFHGHASFHIWAAYSYSANATWATIAREYEASKDDPLEFQTWTNTAKAETWREQGDAPEWRRLYARREHWPPGTVPEWCEFLTCGIDVQKYGWEYEVVGWALNKRSASIDAGQIFGDPRNQDDWRRVDELVARQYQCGNVVFGILRTAVDAGGHWPNETYTWARRYSMNVVVAVRGRSGRDQPVCSARSVDVKSSGKVHKGGYKYFPVCVDMLKDELYGWLHLEVPVDGEPPPPGYCHFPQHGKEYFRQLCSEHLVTVTKPNGRKVREWRPLPGVENHGLDRRIYARAAASLVGLDRVAPQQTPQPARPANAPRRVEREPRRAGGWLRGRKGKWLRGR